METNTYFLIGGDSGSSQILSSASSFVVSSVLSSHGHCVGDGVKEALLATTVIIREVNNILGNLIHGTLRFQ